VAAFPRLSWRMMFYPAALLQACSCGILAPSVAVCAAVHLWPVIDSSAGRASGPAAGASGPAAGHLAGPDPGAPRGSGRARARGLLPPPAPQK